MRDDNFPKNVRGNGDISLPKHFREFLSTRDNPNPELIETSRDGDARMAPMPDIEDYKERETVKVKVPLDPDDPDLGWEMVDKEQEVLYEHRVDQYFEDTARYLGDVNESWKAYEKSFDYPSHEHWRFGEAKDDERIQGQHVISKGVRELSEAEGFRDVKIHGPNTSSRAEYKSSLLSAIQTAERQAMSEDIKLANLDSEVPDDPDLEDAYYEREEQLRDQITDGYYSSLRSRGIDAVETAEEHAKMRELEYVSRKEFAENRFSQEELAQIARENGHSVTSDEIRQLYLKQEINDIEYKAGAYQEMAYAAMWVDQVREGRGQGYGRKELGNMQLSADEGERFSKVYPLAMQEIEMSVVRVDARGNVAQEFDNAANRRPYDVTTVKAYEETFGGKGDLEDMADDYNEYTEEFERNKDRGVEAPDIYTDLNKGKIADADATLGRTP